MDDQIVFRFQKGADGVFRSYIVGRGSQDGRGAGDRDTPYEGIERGQFDLATLRRLLVLRGQVIEAKLGHGPLVDDIQPGQHRPPSGQSDTARPQ